MDEVRQDGRQFHGAPPRPTRLIARRARPDLGRGPSPWRLVAPVLAALITGGYAVWGVLKILEALG